MANEIFGIVMEPPVAKTNGGNGYQQRIKLEGEALAAFQAEETRIRANGGLGKTKTVIYGGKEGRPFFVYGVSSLDAANEGSGKEVGDKVSVALINDNGYPRILVMVSDEKKATADKKKLATLREQAAAVAELKSKKAMLKSAGFDADMSQLALLQVITGAKIDLGSAYTAMQTSKENTSVSRSSRLAAANGGKMEQPITSLHDPEALKGNEELSGN